MCACDLRGHGRHPAVDAAIGAVRTPFVDEFVDEFVDQIVDEIVDTSSSMRPSTVILQN